MSDYLDTFEGDLVDAARRRRRARRIATAVRLRERFGPGRVVALVAALVLVGSATAAATYTVLRGSVIAGPDASVAPPDQLPAAGTARLSELRAADPDADGLPWTLRLSRSETGQLCTIVGQVDGGRFGLVGLDGRFRTYADTAVDACGAAPGAAGGATLAGARVFDADRHEDVRTVVAGVGGPALRAAELIADSRPRPLPLGADGTFVAALPGFPEDRSAELVLRFEGGRVEHHAFGRAPGVIVDPLGGPAWRVEGIGRGGEARICIVFAPASEGLAPDGFDDPHACGTAANERPDGVFFAARRLAPGDPGWTDRPPRTAVWGSVGKGVEAIEIAGPDGRVVARPTIQLGGDFLALFAPEVDPATLTVRTTGPDGRTQEHRGDTNLIETEGQGR